MLTEQAKNELIRCIHSVPQLQSCMIGLYYSNTSSMLHPGLRGTQGYRNCTVIIEVVENSNITVPQTNQIIETEPQNANSGRAWEELGQAGMSCGFTVLAGFGVAAATTAAPATAGASTVLVVAAWGGLVTSSIQCGNGIFRTYMAASGQLRELQEIETDPFYSTVSDWVNWLGIGFSIVTLTGSIRNLMQLKSLLRNQLPANFRNLSRSAQNRAITRLLRRIYEQPQGEALIRQALREAGIREADINRHLSNIIRSSRDFGRVAARARLGNSGFVNIATNLSQREATHLANSIRGAWASLGENVLVFSLERAQSALAPPPLSINVNIISNNQP